MRLMNFYFLAQNLRELEIEPSTFGIVISIVSWKNELLKILKNRHIEAANDKGMVNLHHSESLSWYQDLL